MDDDDERAVFAWLVGVKEIDSLARVIAVAEAELRMLGASSAIERCVALPAANDFRVLRDACAVVYSA